MHLLRRRTTTELVRLPFNVYSIMLALEWEGEQESRGESDMFPLQSSSEVSQRLKSLICIIMLREG